MQDIIDLLAALRASHPHGGGGGMTPEPPANVRGHLTNRPVPHRCTHPEWPCGVCEDYAERRAELTAGHRVCE